MHTSPKIVVSVLLVWCAGLGCTPAIAPFSGLAYEKAVDLKVETLELMLEAESPFEEHSREISSLRKDLLKAFEFNQGRPFNDLSTRQWEILIDPEHHLVGGFLKRWEAETSLSYTFIVEARRIVAEAFDSIIGLESGKLKPDDLENTES